MKADLINMAKSFGFDLCKVTHPEPPETADAYVAWVNKGQNGAMDYLARNVHKRKRPEEILPGIQSIVTLAVNYAPSGEKGTESKDASHSITDYPGIIARYARYTDYHEVLEAPLQGLTQWIDDQWQTQDRSLWYVDTGPILERDLAQRAGLGFVGKHTNLINRDLGNWFFIAEILTQAVIEPDVSEKNHCGKCTRCIEACPTHAITAPFKLDARKCISYLTIELKGSIPEDLRPAIGNRIFGCDDCLAACPWNRFAKSANLMQSHVRTGHDAPALIGLLALDEAGFRTQFRHTPLFRTKRRGILRNVCVALGNSGDKEALPYLEKARQDPEPLIAEHADWAIQQLI